MASIRNVSPIVYCVCNQPKANITYLALTNGAEGSQSRLCWYFPSISFESLNQATRFGWAALMLGSCYLINPGMGLLAVR